MVKLWKIGWNRIEKVGMGKYKIGLRTNMKNSSREIRIANACFPFLIEILSLPDAVRIEDPAAAPSAKRDTQVKF